MESQSYREGADDALSGRPEIWALGLTAVADRPIGWSFDLLRTYWDNHGHLELFPHFHNGFLDIAVKGGLLAEALLVFLIIRMFIAIKNVETVDITMYKVFLSFFISLMIYNLVETALDRENLVWDMLFIVWTCAELNQKRLAPSAKQKNGSLC